MPARPSRKQRSTAGRFDRVSGAPAWISAVAAIGGTIVAAIGVFGLVSQPPASHAPTAAASLPVATPMAARVSIGSVLVGPDNVEAEGDFENVDPLTEEVLFMGRPVGETTESWVAVEALLAPLTPVGPRYSGKWSAGRPAPPPGRGYVWRAIIWPAASGAAGIDDLQRNGPDSAYVLARSEEWISE